MRMTAPTAILTASGQEVCLRYPDVKSILLDDIAHGLSMLHLYGGATRRPYSAAEHALLVCEIVERMLPADAHGLLAALMADAHQAYVGVVTATVQAHLADWHLLDGRLHRTVLSAWGLHGATHAHLRVIHQAQLLAKATEYAQLLPPHTLQPDLVHVQPVEWVNLMAPERCRMAWGEWRAAFIDRANELDYARNEHLYGVDQP